MAEASPGLIEFFLAIWRRWGPLMSGVFSVPFGALSAFSDSAYGRIIWGGMAITAFGTAAYLIWANERKTVVELQNKIKPKLNVSFNMNDPHCVRRNVLLANGSHGDWYRVKVESINDANVDHCSARLLDVHRGTSPIFEGETPRLAFAQQKDPYDVTVSAKIPAYIDLLVVRSDNIALLHLPTPDGQASINTQELFSMPGDHTIRIAVKSDSPTVVTKLSFRWNLDRAKAELLWLENS